MRKQDRIARERGQNHSEQEPANQSQPQRQDGKQVKGSASSPQPEKPPRQPGRMPLPK